VKTLKRGALLLLIGSAGIFLLNAAAVGQTHADLLALKGRWARIDGGYVLEIRNVEPGGRIQAAYYNPNPVNVSRAEAARQGTAVLLFIELRAPGYPGSTYRLIHDPRKDELKGIYRQAALQQDFEVVFARSK
jgi:hypothetical protein